METRENLLERISKAKSLSYLTLNCEQCGKEHKRQVKALRQTIKRNIGFFCSTECYYDSVRGASKYTIFKCAMCDTDVERQTTTVKDTSKVFCSHSCAAAFTNSKRTLKESTKEKISKALKGRKRPNHSPPMYDCKCINCGITFVSTKKKSKSCSESCLGALRKRKKKSVSSKDPKIGPHCFIRFRPCKECGTNFSIIKRKSQVQYCSDHCRNTSISRMMSERLSKAENRVNLGRGKPSYMERTFSEWLYQNSIEFESEVRFKNYTNNRYYFVDFYFKAFNLIIELDGTHHKKTVEQDAERDKYLKEYYNIDVLRITHKEYIKKTKIDLVKQLLGIK